ncbi:MAG: ABC transporter [Kordiimonas sp.]|nr:ABC transporter [Kordiimonas sp.]
MAQNSDRRDKKKRGKLPDEAPKKNIKELTLLWTYLSRHKAVMTFALISLVTAAAATLGIGQALRFMIDLGFSAENNSSIDLYFAALMGVAVVLALATYGRYYLVSWLGERVVAEVRAAVFTKIMSLSPEFFEKNISGDIVSRLTTDTTLIQSVVGATVSVALRNLIMLVGAVIMMGVTSAKLMGLVFLGVPIVIVPIIFFGRRVRALSRETQDRIADVSAQATEVIGAVQTVQSFTQESHEKNRFGGAVEKSFAVAVERIRARAWLTAIVILLIFGAIDFVLWVGATDVINGVMSGGQLAAFLFYAVLVAGTVGSLSEVYGELQRAAGAASRCIELINTPPQIEAPEKPIEMPEPPRGRIEFDQVVFHYPSRPAQAALNKLSLTIEPGETVAVVGPSGAGKSTMFQLLQRFYDPDAGEIRIDGINIKKAVPHHVRTRIAIVPQETVIFAASVEENIRYGRLDASDEEVRAAAKAALVDEFVDRLPDGYQTYLGERGTRLSGGQRQRIAIARAILRDAPILLLDEATSALDAESEKLVQKALDHLMEGRTTLVIAHRLATVLQAGRIMVLEQGQLVASGNHDELLSQGGLYARLAELQFGEKVA